MKRRILNKTINKARKRLWILWIEFLERVELGEYHKKPKWRTWNRTLNQELKHHKKYVSRLRNELPIYRIDVTND